MKIVADANGHILRVVRVDDLLGTADATSLEFDPDTNPTILPALEADRAGHRLLAGVLTRADVPYVIAADGENETVRKQAVQMVADLTTYLGIGSPNTAQNVLALKTLARAVRYLIKREFGVA